MRTLFLSVFAAAAACGGGGSNTVDAPATSDGNHRVDAAIDAAVIDAAIVGCTAHCVVSAESVPTTTAEARDEAIDLDGDGQVDNQFGLVLAAFAGQGLDFQTPTTRAVDHGDIITLVDFEQGVGSGSGSGSGSGANPVGHPATLALFAGADPVPSACSGSADPTCRHQLSGTAMFTVAAGSGENPALGGSYGSGALAAGPGHLTLQTAMFGAPLALDLIGARVSAPTDGTELTSVLVGGGVTTQEMMVKIYPAIATSAQAEVAAGCTDLSSPPQCGCPSGSEAKTLLALYDTTPQDCHITTAEVENNTLIKTLFMPDVTLEGQMVVSFGMTVSVVGAMYTPPAN